MKLAITYYKFWKEMKVDYFQNIIVQLFYAKKVSRNSQPHLTSSSRVCQPPFEIQHHGRRTPRTLIRPEVKQKQFRWPYKKASTEVSEPNKSKRSSVHKTNLEHSNFYNLVMFLFPEVSSEPAVDIAVMDTLFFLPDHSLHYVYQVYQYIVRILEKDWSDSNNVE